MRTSTASGNDNGDGAPYSNPMRALIVLALFGLMALVFYSSRHGYDDDANRFR